MSAGAPSPVQGGQRLIREPVWGGLPSATGEHDSPSSSTVRPTLPPQEHKGTAVRGYHSSLDYPCSKRSSL